METEACIFRWKFNCQQDSILSEAGPEQIKTIISCSKEYGDDFHKQLQLKLNEDSSMHVHCHRNCVSTYTSRSQVIRHLNRTAKCVEDPIPSKRQRRCDVPTFVFQKHCLFCGLDCNVVKDKKHPKRWRKSILCRTADRGPRANTFKENIVATCSERGDTWASQVLVRVQGALSDLHAADARYHVDCMAKFMSKKSVERAARELASEADTDEAFESLIEKLGQNKSEMWNSAELFEIYQSHGGHKVPCRQLIQQVSDYFGGDILVLSSPGISSIIMFHEKASALLKIKADQEDGDISYELNKVKRKIAQEVKALPLIDKTLYNVSLNKDIAMECVSDTVLELLSKLSAKLDRTLPAILIGNIITNVLTNRPTSLQIALGVLMKNSKALVSQMNDFGVTCSYDELRCFKKSAANAATKQSSGISGGGLGMVQVVADNFDADISSQNGKLSTHSLAVLLTQPEHDSHNAFDTPVTITRIPKSAMAKPVDYNINSQHYRGPKNPQMPSQKSLKSVLPLKLPAHGVIKRNHLRMYVLN